MTDTENRLDEQRIDQLSAAVTESVSGAMQVAMIWLGDHLGLYRAMAGAGPLTSVALAVRTGLAERWLREWLEGQAVAGYLQYRGEAGFELSAEAAAVFADERGARFLAGGLRHLPVLLGDVLLRTPEAFRTGLGLSYDDLGPAATLGVEGVLAPWFAHSLIPQALPALDGVLDKLRAGARVADVGCGTGDALLEMAAAFPASQFHGYDLSRHALARGQKKLDASGLGNVTLHDVSAEPLARDGSFDLITCFDSIHDMAHPSEVMAAIRATLAPDGTCFIVDLKCGDHFEDNLAAASPLTTMLYGFSLLCCMSSSLSTPTGEGLGTLGFSERRAREMSAAAGFRRFKRHDFGSPINAFYELRP